MHLLFNPALGDVNTATLSNSKYGDKHRFIGVASKKWSYGTDKKWSTVSTFFEYAQGGRFNYGGDINNDGSPTNDLIYVPTTAQLQTMVFNLILHFLQTLKERLMIILSVKIAT
jgi:hypothetical protein